MNDLLVLEAGLISPLGGLADFAWPPVEDVPRAVSAEALSKALAAVPGLGPNLRRTPRLARLALAALAPLAPRRDDSTQALVLATAYGPAAATFEFLDSLLRDGPNLASPTAFAHSVTNMAAALLGLHLGLTGPALTVAGFSLTPALETAAALLAAGEAETVFLGAAAELSPVMAEVETMVGRIVSSPVEVAVFFRLGPAAAYVPGALRLVLADGLGAEAGDLAPEEAALGRGPLASAWRLALAWSRLQSGSVPGEWPAFPGEKFRLAGGGHA
jgi:hypothetical protein